MCCVAGVLQHDPDRASGPVLGDGVCRGGEGGRCSDERRRGAGLLVRHHQRGGRDRVRQRGDQGTADRRQVQHCASLSLSPQSAVDTTVEMALFKNQFCTLFIKRGHIWDLCPALQFGDTGFKSTGLRQPLYWGGANELL